MNYDLIVIGSGPGGYVAAIRAAQLGMKVACIEKGNQPGGTCLNVGCIPSKTLLHTSHWYSTALHDFKSQGILIENPKLDFVRMMQRKDKVIAGFNDGIRMLFQKNQIALIQGAAQFESINSIRVNGELYYAKQFVIATGSEPISLPFLPFDEEKIVSSTGALALKQVPKRLLVIGCGVIGLELGSVYSRLGTEVECIEFLDRICPVFDGAISTELVKILAKQGIRFRLSTKVSAAVVNQAGVELTAGTEKIQGDIILVAIGRRPYTNNLGLEKIGLQTDAKGFIPVDCGFRTKIPTVYAIGDVIDGPMLAHKASEEGVAVAEILAGQTPKIHYIAIPNVLYTHPEAAAVGLTQEQATAFGIAYQIGLFPFKASSRARCIGEEEGFVKIILEKASHIVIGVHIIGAHASELITEASLVVQHRMTAEDVVSVSHPHPTLSEAIKEAALAALNRPIHR